MKKSKSKKKKGKLMQSLIVATGTGALLSSAAMAGTMSDSQMKNSHSKTAQITAQKDAPMLIAAAKKKTTAKKRLY